MLFSIRWQNIVLNKPSFLMTIFIRVYSFSTQKSKNGLKCFPYCLNCWYQFHLMDPFFPSPLESSMLVLMPLNIFPSQVLSVLSSYDPYLHSGTHCPNPISQIHQENLLLFQHLTLKLHFCGLLTLYSPATYH